MRAYAILSFVILLAILPLPGRARDASPDLWQIPSGTYVLRPQSKLLFFVSAVNGAAYQGDFKAFTARMDYDAAHPTHSQLAVTVTASSATMDSDNLTDTLRGEDFFDVTRFPQIIFTARGLHQTDARHGEMTGNVTVRGITKPLTLHVEFIGAHYNEDEQREVLSFHATASLPRADFDMDKYPAILGDDVELMIMTEFARLEKGDAAQ